MRPVQSTWAMSAPTPQLPKTLTGIRGLDDITNGGLPKGRSTLVCGSSGCGKTLMAMEFLVHGALQYDEPGVFLAFEEAAEDLVSNVASLGFNLNALIADKKLVVDAVQIERSEFEESGKFDLDGLFIRLAYAIDSINARRVVLDTVETIFACFSNHEILRFELCRLLRWLKDKGVTAVITGERGEGTLTRYGIEEYVSDCVIVLDHRVIDQHSTRRLRVHKYRGSVHGTNEYPFLIDELGISVLPVTSMQLQYTPSQERLSTGIARLDTMLGGQGFYRSSTVQVSGTPGSGKTSLAAHIAQSSCQRGERCLYFLFEESALELIRNMRSIGLNLEPWVEQGLLRFHATQPALNGLEMHLVNSLRVIEEFAPQLVIFDSISSFQRMDSESAIQSMLIRIKDILKVKGITTIFLNQTRVNVQLEQVDPQILSLIDTWILLRDFDLNGERNTGLYVLKSRGMAHSHQIREFTLTDHGIELSDVYVGPAGLLTGSARMAQEAREQAELLATSQSDLRQTAALERKRHLLESQISALRAEYAAAETESQLLDKEAQQRRERLQGDRIAMGINRQADLIEPIEPIEPNAS
jgi:circadian clock protein KaiC